MAKASDNPFPSVLIRESADDGSDFSNPAADYRRLFLGEDGDLHLKDSAGAVTDVGGVGGAGSYTYTDEKVAGVGGSASFDFTSISGSGRHLVIEAMLRGEKAAAFDDVHARVNGDTGSNYDLELQSAFQTTNSATQSLAATSWGVLGQPAAASATAGLFGYFKFSIPYYASTVFSKAGYVMAADLAARGTGGFLVRHGALFWRSTAAITQVTLYFAGGDIAEGSKASLYLVT